MTTVIALGGNALLRDNEVSLASQNSAIARTVSYIKRAFADSSERLVITHGNGPQVGLELMKNIDARLPLPLYMLTGETQASIGSTLALELSRALRAAAVVLTHVIVDRKDPAFAKPSKPIGPLLSKGELERYLVAGLSFERVDQNIKFSSSNFNNSTSSMMNAFSKHSKQANQNQNSNPNQNQNQNPASSQRSTPRLYRLLAPSPRPLKILEEETIKSLKTIVVCCGGGGIPIDERLNPLNAVIDKDLTSSLLATRLNASKFIILTNVPYVYDSGPLRSLSVGSALSLASRSDPGSMQPKLIAAASFVQHTGRKAYIGSLSSLDKILKGKEGTVIEE